MKQNTDSFCQITSYTPHPDLKEYVYAYAYTDLQAPALVNMDLFPCGITTLTIILSDESEITCAKTGRVNCNKFYFVGQYSRYTPLYSRSTKAITVTFKPHGAYALFGVPQFFALDRHINAIDIFPELKDIQAQLEDLCAYPEKCIAVIEAFLLKKIKLKTFEDNRIVYACNLIRQDKGNLPVKELSNRVAMSERSLELHFKEKIGLSPKLYSRILRFCETVNYIKSQTKIDWQDVSYQFNYFDQNHFIREFKQFFGRTPTQISSPSHAFSFFVAEGMNENSLK